MKGSDTVVLMLEPAGVEIIFGLCGDTSLPLYESLDQLQSRMKHVVTCDERSAAYMAVFQSDQWPCGRV